MQKSIKLPFIDRWSIKGQHTNNVHFEIIITTTRLFLPGERSCWPFLGGNGYLI